MTPTTSTSRRIMGAALSASALATLGFTVLGGSAAHAEDNAMIMPTSGSITGTPNGYCRSGNSHEGFDIAAPQGATVVAAADGTVRQADYASSPGNRVVIDHAGGWETRYLHLYSKAVKTGQTVKKGQVVGTVGNTGSSSGNHLHFQIERNNSVIRDSTLLNDFTCGSSVTRGNAITYSFPGLPGGSTSTGNYPKLREGDRGDAVKSLQTTLTAAGHSVTADGVFGADTLAAVKAFQTKVGTTADGVVGPKTWGALVTAPADGTKLRDGSTGTQVKYLQRGLNATLGKSLSVDGKFGSGTLAAVKEYQASRGLVADGVVGDKTWHALKHGQ